MRYKWGFKKDIPKREKGDPPKLLVRHLEFLYAEFPNRYIFNLLGFNEWSDYMNEVTMGWHPCITAQELSNELTRLAKKYNIKRKD